MRNIDDVKSRLTAEINHWFSRQCANPTQAFYLYVQDTGARHDGGFIIAKEQPANPEYYRTVVLDISATKEQNFASLFRIVSKLPILAKEDQP